MDQSDFRRVFSIILRSEHSVVRSREARVLQKKLNAFVSGSKVKKAASSNKLESQMNSIKGGFRGP